MHSQTHEKTILFYEEEPDARRPCEIAVRSLGYAVQAVRSGEDVLSFLRTTDVQVAAVILDMAAPHRRELDLLRDIRSLDARLPLIVVSGRASMPDAIAVMKCGATDFLGKPVAHDELARVLASPPETRHSAARPVPRGAGEAGPFAGASSHSREMRKQIRQVGWSGVPVVIQGETGSGKEVLARELHAASARASQPFLKLNCAALPSELVESELFGYERGAFTGAFQKKPGMFELADGGTILLDEIGDMDVRLQAKLLQVLQDQEFRRVGGRDLVSVDVRVLAATHRDLEAAIRAGTFREDLYYRLNVITLHVPPLRERSEDIVRIGESLLGKYASPGSPAPVISFPLRQAMLAYHWPGNVRELENYMRKLIVFNDADLIARELQLRGNRKTAAETVPGAALAETPARSRALPVLEQVTRVNRQAESEAILATLHSTRWNRKQAAMILKVDYKSLLYKMKKLGIDERPAPGADEAEPPSRSALAASGD